MAFRPGKALIAPLFLASLPTLADHPTLAINNGYGAAIIGQSAQVLPKDTMSMAFKQEFLKNDTFSTEKLEQLEGEDVHSVDFLEVYTLGLAWGQTDRLTLGLSLPFISRNNIDQAPHHHEDEEEEEHAGAESLGDASGIGDLTIYGQYQFYRSQDGQRLASAYVGIKLPTGKTNRNTDGGERFEAEHQPGAGSWGSLLGVALSQGLGAWTIDNSLMATLATEGSQDTDLGNALNYDLALSRPLIVAEDHRGHSHSHHSHGLLSTTTLVMELNGEWRDKVDIDGMDADNTGGNLVYFSLGLRTALPDMWSVSLSAGVPVVENLNGIQAEPEWRTNLTLAKAIRF